MKIIAKIKSDFSEKFGIPRQSGLVPSLKSKIVFEPAYRNSDALRGLEDFSHIWLLWEFSKSKRDTWSPTVRPPRLGGNRRMGVFATRSPFRPNPIGLSCVKLDRIEWYSAEGPLLYISGADLLNDTPIYDIKPYLSFADAHPDALGSFSTTALEHRLNVHCEDALLHLIPKEKRQSLLDCLSLDPRPSYQHDPERIYGMQYAGFDIHFSVNANNLFVTDVIPSHEKQ